MCETCRWNIFHAAQLCKHWQSANKEDFLLLHFNTGYQCHPTIHFPSPRYSSASFEDEINVPFRALPFSFLFSSLCHTEEWTNWRFWSALPGGLFWAWILQLLSKQEMKGLRKREHSFRFLQHQKKGKIESAEIGIQRTVSEFQHGRCIACRQPYPTCKTSPQNYCNW